MRLTISFILLVAFGSYGQDTTLVHLVEQLDAHYATLRKKDVAWKNEQNYGLKFSPLHLAAGDIGFYFEHRLGQRTSIEIGGGPTISKIGLNNFNPVVYYPNDILIDYIYQPYNQTVSKVGFLSSLELRYYPLEGAGALNQFYMGPSIKYKLYNYGIRSYTNEWGDTWGQDMRFNAYFNWGLQIWPSNKFLLDIFFGAGIGYRYQIYGVQQAFFEEGEYFYYWRREEQGEFKFLLNTGVKIGFGRGR